jgi:hypothetical protein
VGQLTYRGGIALRSPDPRFGGFSALHVSADGGTALMISDRGAWVTLDLQYGSDGMLAGVRGASMDVLTGKDGKPLRYRDTDAEGLAVLADGSMLVAFEHNHRILRYPAARRPFAKAPTQISVPPEINRAPHNFGIEAIAQLGDGRFVVLSEWLPSANGSGLSAWVGKPGTWEQFAYLSKPGFRISDAGVLPGGDLVVLEHHYNFILGHITRLTHVKRTAIAAAQQVEGREISVLSSPLIAENFEGVSTRRGNGGETLLYLVSDDNFNPRQRTLLLMFAYRDYD